MEQIVGNDPTSEHWQCSIIPLYDTCKVYANLSKVSNCSVVLIGDGSFR